MLQRHDADTALPQIDGAAAIIAGSCSAATNAQVAHWLKHRPGYRIDVHRLLAGADVVGDALACNHQESQTPVLVYTTSTPDEVRAVQEQSGVEWASTQIEQALAEIAWALAQKDTRKFVIAGGETSGAVVKRLGIRALRIGPAIDPGVPWTSSIGGNPVALALKSGNFGTVDFFEKALMRLQ